MRSGYFAAMTLSALSRTLRSSHPKALKLLGLVAAAMLLAMALYWTKCRVGINIAPSHSVSGIEPFKTLYWMAVNRIPF